MERSSIRSPHRTSLSPVGNPNLSINYPLDEIDLDLELDGGYLSLPYVYNGAEQNRIIANFRNQHQPTSPHDDTINCNEWLLYVKYDGISFSCNGQSLEVEENASVDVMCHGYSEVLKKSRHTWMNYMLAYPSIQSHSTIEMKARNFEEVVFNIYEYYGNHNLSIQLNFSSFFFSRLKGSNDASFVKEISLAYIMKCQEKYDSSRQSSLDPYVFPHIVKYHVKSDALRALGIRLPKSVARMSNVDVEVSVQLNLRLVSLRQCCRLSNYTRMINSPIVSESKDANNTTTERLHELHLVAARGPPHLLEKLVLSLARKSYLRRSMQLLSSTSISTNRVSPFSQGVSDLAKNPFDIALAHGNFDNAKILLERMGHLCFHGSLVGGRSCALHYAIRGQNYRCVALILKYLHFYGPVPSRGGRELLVRLRDMIEWRDESDYTPLLLACHLSRFTVSSENSYSYPATQVQDMKSVSADCSQDPFFSFPKIVEILLKFRADCGAISSKTNENAFILACKAIPSDQEQPNVISTSNRDNISTELIRLLLKAKKSRAEINQLSKLNSSINKSRRSSAQSVMAYIYRISSLLHDKPLAPVDVLGSPALPRNMASRDENLESGSYTEYSELVNSYFPYDSVKRSKRVPLNFLKCNVFHQDNDKKTGFAYAVEAGNLSAVQLLLSYGISYMDILGNHNENIIHVCARKGLESLIDHIALMEYDRYRKYRIYLKRFPQQLIHYRMKIFAVKNELGLTPYDIAVMEAHNTNVLLNDDLDESQREEVLRLKNVFITIADKISYYCHIIYGSSNVGADATLTFIRGHSVNDGPQESKKSVELRNASMWSSEMPFQAFLSIFMRPSDVSTLSGSASNSNHAMTKQLGTGKKVVNQPSLSTVACGQELMSESVAGNEGPGGVDNDGFPFDDEADDLNFEFALAPKSGPVQNYYIVAGLENQKISEVEERNASSMEGAAANGGGALSPPPDPAHFHSHTLSPSEVDSTAITRITR